MQGDDVDIFNVPYTVSEFIPCSYHMGWMVDGKASHVNDLQASSRVGPMRIKLLCKIIFLTIEFNHIKQQTLADVKCLCQCSALSH